MKFSQGKWVKYEPENLWICFVEETIIGDKAMKWFWHSSFDPAEWSGAGHSPYWGHLCLLRGEDCLCREIKKNFSYDAIVSKREFRENKVYRKDKYLRGYVIKNGNYLEVSLGGKRSLNFALEQVEKQFVRCDCGSAKLNLPHSHWCSKESYRRDDV